MRDSDCNKPCDATPTKIPRGHHTPQHIAGVASLVAEGWREAGLRRGIHQAVALDFAAEVPGASAAKFDCTRFGACKCVSPEEQVNEETGETYRVCFWDKAHYDVRAFYIRPDAWRIDPAERTVWIAEVNVTHHAGVQKWAALWDVLDYLEWSLRLVIVDRNGVRSEPFSDLEMFTALYEPMLEAAVH